MSSAWDAGYALGMMLANGGKGKSQASTTSTPPVREAGVEGAETALNFGAGSSAPSRGQGGEGSCCEESAGKGGWSESWSTWNGEQACPKETTGVPNAANLWAHMAKVMSTAPGAWSPGVHADGFAAAGSTAASGAPEAWGSVAQGSWLAEAGTAGPTDVPPGVKTHHGKIKSFFADRGYGFIECSETKAKYGADVYINQRMLEGLRVGDALYFTMATNATGQPQAKQIWPEARHMGPNHQVRQEVEEAGLPGEARRFVGQIKSWNDSQGFGFIESAEVRQLYGMSVYIHQRQLHGFKIGDTVSFTIIVNNKGQPQARGVMTEHDADRVRVKRSREQFKQDSALRMKQVNVVMQNMQQTAQPAVMMTEEEARNFQLALKKQRM